MGPPKGTDLVWRKSGYSHDSDCVEVAELAGGVAVRDSKDPAGTVLVINRDGWASFLSTAKADGFRPRVWR